MIQYNNFLIKREQSRAGSRFAECEKSRLKAKILMTLALLLTAVTGAWAQTETPLVTILASENSTFTSGSKTFNDIATVTITGDGYIDGFGWEGCTLTVTPADGVTITSVKFYGTPDGVVGEDTSSPFEAEIKYDSNVSRQVTKVNGTKAFNYGVTKIEVFGTAGPPLTVEWNASTKTGSFQMPGSDVVLTPLYAPTAKWDVVETVEQQPAALEGIIAGQDEAIVTPGQSAQGTVMYAVTTTADAAPALTAFSATVPTAKTYDDATTLYVWYYIQGHDTPDGQQPTEENTFNDSEISTTPLTVQVLTNKFDITFNAANANTIEAGKATVTVGGTAATVTDGKLQAVKMGSEVKMTAQPGYKFRKVEVKKYEAPSLNITNPEVGQVIGSDGKNYAYSSLPTGVTPVAKICYVSGSNGLALALTDEGVLIDWSTAIETCAAHTAPFTGGTWKLASKDELNNMVSAAGSYSALRDGFSSVGGTNIQSSVYWSSTENGSIGAWEYYFSNGNWFSGAKGNSAYVRACLAF